MANDEQLIALALSKLPATRSLPSKSYVVLVLGGEEFDVADPEIIGPFNNYQQAYEYIARLPNATIAPHDDRFAGHITLHPAPQPKSGYAGWAIINDQTAANPQTYLKHYDRDIMQPNDHNGLFEYSMLFGENTNLPCTIYVSEHGFVTTDPYHPNTDVCVESLANRHAEAITAWTVLNHEVLQAHWRGDIDSKEMCEVLQKLPE